MSAPNEKQWLFADGGRLALSYVEGAGALSGASCDPDNGLEAVVFHLSGINADMVASIMFYSRWQAANGGAWVYFGSIPAAAGWRLLDILSHDGGPPLEWSNTSVGTVLQIDSRQRRARAESLARAAFRTEDLPVSGVVSVEV